MYSRDYDRRDSRDRGDRSRRYRSRSRSRSRSRDRGGRDRHSGADRAPYGGSSTYSAGPVSYGGGGSSYYGSGGGGGGSGPTYGGGSYGGGSYSGGGGFGSSGLGAGLRNIDWAAMQAQLPVFEKNFYFEHPDVQHRSDADAERWRAEHGITVFGQGVPKPVLTFEEASMPEYVLREVLKQGFEKRE